MEQHEYPEAINIEKELIPTLKFSKRDVLNDPVKRRLREIYLLKGERLGNGYKGKVDITFVDETDKCYMVHTTIWSVDHEHVTLKAGVHIPTSSILSIEFN
jgi:hypothetical protein